MKTKLLHLPIARLLLAIVPVYPYGVAICSLKQQSRMSC